MKKKREEMENLENLARIFPMVVSNLLSETKEFYLQAGFKVRHEVPGQYLQVHYEPGDDLDLCFMVPHTGSNGKAYPAFSGAGLVFSIPTPSADKKCAEFEKRGVHIDNPLEDKPWGWRSFHVTDPNGCVLDFFHVYRAPEGAS